jgi:transcriptional pleiotropic regulator of transition state genes
MISDFKSTGIVRKVDDLGRVVIPKGVIDSLGYEKNQSVKISLLGTESVVIAKDDGTAQGTARRVDDLNRLVIPMEIRKRFSIATGTPLEIFVSTSNAIILKVYTELCSICGNSENLYIVKNKRMCSDCIDFVKNNL